MKNDLIFVGHIFDNINEIEKSFSDINKKVFLKNKPVEVQLAVFAGTTKITFLDIKQYEDNIIILLESCESYIKERINWRADLSGSKRIEIPEIPIRALKEALVNSFCHRDYTSPESNKIAIYKDRIEIWNPGNFPEGFVPLDFVKKDLPSILRNPLIANILFLSEDIEKWGSGIRRIYEECALQGVKVEFEVLKYGFSVIFYRNGLDTNQTQIGQKDDMKNKVDFAQIRHKSGTNPAGVDS
jgi:ATP-dependent DNA helicase RecG